MIGLLSGDLLFDGVIPIGWCYDLHFTQVAFTKPVRRLAHSHSVWFNVLEKVLADIHQELVYTHLK